MRKPRILVIVATVIGMSLSSSRVARGDYTFATIATQVAPEGSLILDAQGNIYGASTRNAIFKISPGTDTSATFFGINGSGPTGNLVQDGQGNLYGTTQYGGNVGVGNVFKVSESTGSSSSLASFGYGSGGAYPTGGLAMDAQGNLYGTTSQGGTGSGNVFMIAAGTGVQSSIASFTGTNGSLPLAGVTLDARGNIYGTTAGGGAGGYGTVYMIAAGTNVIDTLFNFDGMNGKGGVGNLTLDSQGNIYGTTGYGGLYNDGTVFKIAANGGTFSTLASFNGTNGANPMAGLTIDSHGDLFGTTSGGGVYADGTAFEIAASTGTLSTIASFNYYTTGATPTGGLTLDAQGDLYGTLSQGYGPLYGGSVFELSPSTVVPEPASMFILAQGGILFGIGLAIRSRGRRTTAR